MCCGAIAIRTPAAGWRDQVIEGQTGFIIPFDDPSALAAAVENVVDSPRRAEMREYAMRTATERFARTRMIDGISSLYRQMAAR
jgi:glycosyltransferase involved in cell wall biosynthesis